MKRRVVAARRRKNDDETRIPATRRAINEISNRQLDTTGVGQDTTGHTWPNRIRQLQHHVTSGKKEAQIDRYLRHDRETIVFLVLAILGAALVVIACLTLNIISIPSFSRFTEMPSFLSDGISNRDNKKGHKITHPTANKFDHQKIVYLPTHFGDHDDILYEAYYSRRVDDGVDDYYAFDDDYQRNPFKDESYEDVKHCCRRISEHRLYFPNCNTFHETPMLESKATFIGSGSYRRAMRMNLSFGREKETVVVKDIHLEKELGYEYHEYTRMDAIVAERLTASPRIYDIYGACGIGIIAEYFPHGQVEEIAIPTDNIDFSNEENGPLICYNNLTALVKLELSLDMAEALADLHGYPGGPIVHQDVKLDQFFFSADMSRIILNDFNRAEFLLWDHCNERYCGYEQGYGSGNWRSPEEYYDELLTEKIDVFSLGNNIYGVLTGMMPFHEETTPGVQYLVGQGERPFIDPRYKERSLAEVKLVEIIESCHEYYERDRPSIFEVVDFLRHALQEVNDAIGNKNL